MLSVISTLKMSGFIPYGICLEETVSMMKILVFVSFILFLLAPCAMQWIISRSSAIRISKEVDTRVPGNPDVV